MSNEVQVLLKLDVSAQVSLGGGTWEELSVILPEAQKRECAGHQE